MPCIYVPLPYQTWLLTDVGYPIIGSVPDVPEKNGFIKFADWGKEYGPIYQVNLAGTNHVWISSDQVAKDLLSKKGSIYSDRPHIPALIDDNRTSAQYLPLLSKNGRSTHLPTITHTSTNSYQMDGQDRGSSPTSLCASLRRRSFIDTQRSRPSACLLSSWINHNFTTTL